MQRIIRMNKRLATGVWRDLKSGWLLWFSMALLVLLFYHRPLAFLFNETVDSRLAAYDLLADDAFYYLTIARNIVESSISTFDGVTPTNGYHPLWMVILVLVGYVVPIDSLTYIYVLNGLIVLCVAMGTYILGRVRKQYTSDSINSPVLLMYFYAALFIARGGMEVVLVFLLAPLLFLSTLKLVQRPGARLLFITSLIAALLILSRLDTVILVLLLGLVIVVHVQPALRWRNLMPWSAALVAGFAPFLLYLLYNRVVYDAFVPISGQAKTLAVAPFLISQRGLESFLEAVLEQHGVSLFFYVTVASLPFALYWATRRRQLRSTLFLAVTLFPFVFFAFYLTRSDWPYWLWYFYPLALTFAFTLMLVEIFLLDKAHFYRKWRPLFLRAATVTVTFAVLMQYVFFSPQTYSPFPYVEAAVEVAEFAETHPGIYAMGDRAGSVGFLLPYRLVQLEGLVGDRQLLTMIAEERQLKEVLRQYGVDYYVTTNPPRVDGCWLVEEPRVPGDFAPRMEARICSEPAFHFWNNGTATIFRVDDMVLAD